MRYPSWIMTAVAGLALAACGSDMTGTEGDAVVTGSVENSAEANTAVIGEVSGSGNYQAIDEVDVDSEGEFRFEEVPSGRSNLVVRVMGDAGAVVGSVVLKETTVAGATHRTHPIGGRSTVHAEVWAEAQTMAGESGSMGAAELALFLDAGAAAGGDPSDEEITALAQASIEAQEAISAALIAHGAGLTAEARQEVLASAAAERDAERDAGTGANLSQQTFLAAAFDAYVANGMKAEALASAYAAAATVFARASAGIGTSAHFETTREAVLVNIDVRKRAAAATEDDPLGLRSSANLTLNALDVAVLGASSMSELQAALDGERALIENRVAVAALASLPVLGGTVEALVDSRTRAAVESSKLWIELESATSATGMGTAAGNTRTETTAAVADLIDAIPTSAGTISADAAISILLLLGAGASVD